MAGLEGVEPIIDAIIAQLKAYLPAKLTALAGSLTPTLALPAPVVAEYTFGEKKLHTTYPALEVYPLTTENELDSTDTEVDRHRIGIVIFVRHADTEMLERLRMRYLRAVKEVMADRRAAQAFGTVGIDWNDEMHDWPPTREVERAVLQQDILFKIRASKSEQRV